MLSAQEDMRLAGEVTTIDELMSALSSGVDFLVADVALLADAEDSQVYALRQCLTHIPSLFLSKEDRPECLDAAMRAGGRAYMLKSTPVAGLMQGIRRVMAGHDMKELVSTADLKALAESGRKAGRPDALTNREQEILRLLAEGRTVRETASELALSIKTVEAHKLNLMRKLNIHNRASLIEYAIERGYIPAAVPA